MVGEAPHELLQHDRDHESDVMMFGLRTNLTQKAMDVLATMLDPMADTPEEMEARVTPPLVLKLTTLGSPALAIHNRSELDMDGGTLVADCHGHVTLAAVHVMHM